MNQNTLKGGLVRFRVGQVRRDPCPRMQSVSEKRLFSARIAETYSGYRRLIGSDITQIVEKNGLR